MTPAGVDTGTGQRFLPEAWRAEQNGEVTLIGARCPACGQMAFPPVEVCPRCLAEPLQLTPMPRAGVVVASSVVHVPERGISAPYAIGQVELGEVVLTARLADLSLAPGTRVRPVVGVLRDGDPSLLGWVFEALQ